MQEIHQYIRNGKNDKIGMMLGRKLNDGSVVITASKAAITKGDKFNPIKAHRICFERSWLFENEGRPLKPIANSMRNAIYEFENRCKRYFKTEEIIMPIVN